MNELSEKLRTHIDAANERDMIWGVDDCTAWVAAWLETALDTSIERPRWTTREEAMQLIDAAGSLEALWSDVLCNAGLYETGDPQEGDVGLIRSSKGDVGGIFLYGGYFAWRGEPRGIAILRPRLILRSWSIR